MATSHTHSGISMRLKVVIIVLLSIIALSASMYAVSSLIIAKSYIGIEHDTTLRNLSRVEKSIGNSVIELNIKLRDWAQWDDAYQFANDHNEEFITSNLQPTTLINLEIHLLMFTDTAGNVTFKRVVDLERETDIPDETLSRAVISNKEFITHTDTNSSAGGILSLPEGLLLVTSLPVLTTAGEGPIAGTIVFGRFLDEEKIAALEELTELSIDIFPYDSATSPQDVRDARAALINGETHVTHALSADKIAGYAILRDIDNVPVGILRIDTSRPIFNQGKSTFNFFMIIAASSILAFGIIVIFLLEYFFIRRIARLSTEVGTIGTSGDLARRVSLDTEDEIGRLATAINTMLAQIAHAQTIEQTLRESEKAAGEELRARLEEIEKMNRLMVNREHRMVELKENIKKFEDQLRAAGINPE